MSWSLSDLGDAICLVAFQVWDLRGEIVSCHDPICEHDDPVELQAGTHVVSLDRRVTVPAPYTGSYTPFELMALLAAADE